MQFLRRYTARSATSADRNAVLALTRYEERVHLHLDWKPIDDWLGNQSFWLVERGPRVVGALACPADTPDVAWVRLLAVAAGHAEADIWAEAWPHVQAELRAQRVPALAALSLEQWSNRLYTALGFKRTHDVVVLTRPMAAPLNTAILRDTAYVRAAEPADHDTIIHIDQTAFQPPWRLSAAMLRLAIVQAENLTVAEMDGQVVGFQLTTPSRAGAHLARLAVLPGWQGKGIGRALVGRLVRDCQQKRRGEITVNTQNTNATSLAVYQRLGFRLNGVRFPVFQHLLD